MSLSQDLRLPDINRKNNKIGRYEDSGRKEDRSDGNDGKIKNGDGVGVGARKSV